MYNRQPIAIRLYLTLIVLCLFGCSSKYMVFDEHGKRVPPSEEQFAAGRTRFEQSLSLAYEDPFDVTKIGYYLMYDLLRKLAEHDRPNSDRQVLFDRLTGLDIVLDSARVMRIFNQGLAELDVSLDASGRNMFVDEEIPRRADQIRQYGCFLPRSSRHFDALGEFVMYHGVFSLESWDSETMIVTFSNGMALLIEEEECAEHHVLAAAESLDKLEILILADSLTGYEMPTMGESKQFILQQQGQVRLDVDYDELKVIGINVHVLPTSLGDGRWNGRIPPAGEGQWDYSRVFADFYINLAELNVRQAHAENVIDLKIEYEIWQVDSAVQSQVAAETLSFHREVIRDAPDAGIAFRVISRPFLTSGASSHGHYQLNMRLFDGRRITTRKFPLVIEEDHYELLVLDDNSSQMPGIPPCQRVPTARPEQTVTVLVPVKGLPYCEEALCYCGRVDFYLMDNDVLRTGKVEIGEIETVEFVDSSESNSNVSEPTYQSAIGNRAPLVTVKARSESPNTYLTCRINIPRELPNGSKVRPGRYSIGAIVVSSDGIVSEALMTDLRME